MGLLVEAYLVEENEHNFSSLVDFPEVEVSCQKQPYVDTAH